MHLAAIGIGIPFHENIHKMQGDPLSRKQDSVVEPRFSFGFGIELVHSSFCSLVATLSSVQTICWVPRNGNVEKPFQ